MEQSVNEEITLKEVVLKVIGWVRYFVSKWRIIAVGGFVGATIGLLVAYTKKPIYVAELTLALEEKGSGSSYSGLASQFGIDLGAGSGGAFSGENTIELMKSRNIIEKALLTAVEIEGEKQLLINRFIDFNEWRDEWEQSRPDLADVVYKENEDRDGYSIKKDSILFAVCKMMRGPNLTIGKIDKKLNIIKVSFKSNDELFAKYFVEVLVNAASDLYVKTKTQKSKKNLAILEERLDSVKRELDANIFSAALTKDQNYNIVRARGGVSLSKKQLNIQVLTAMYGELIKNAEVAKYTLMREEPLIQVIDRPIFPLEKIKLGKIKGVILGGFFGVFIFMIILFFVRIYLKIKSSLF